MSDMTAEMQLAVHECGHALGVLVSGGHIDCLTLTSDADDVSSACEWADLPDPIDELFCIAAGPAASSVLCGDTDPWGEDGADTDATDFLRVLAASPGVERQSESDRAIRLANGFAEDQTHRDIISRMAAALVERGELTEGELIALAENRERAAA